MIQFTSSQGVLEEYTTRLAPAPQDSKRTLGYQDLTNADRLFNKNSCFQAFQQEICRQNCPETTNDYFIVSFPAHGEEKGAYVFF